MRENDRESGGIVCSRRMRGASMFLNRENGSEKLKIEARKRQRGTLEGMNDTFFFCDMEVAVLLFVGLTLFLGFGVRFCAVTCMPLSQFSSTPSKTIPLC